MTYASRRSSLLAALAVIAGFASATLAPPAAAAYPKTYTCKTVFIKHKGGAKSLTTGIRATGYPCARARVIVRACLRDRLRGWKVSTSPSPDDRNSQGTIGLDRGSAHVSFQVRGRRGCA